MMAYTGVLLLELSPALLERWRGLAAGPSRVALASAWLPRARARAAVHRRARPRPPDDAPVEPRLAAPRRGDEAPRRSGTPGSCRCSSSSPPSAMGYAVIYFESIFSAVAFRRPLETKLLARLGRLRRGGPARLRRRPLRRAHRGGSARPHRPLRRASRSSSGSRRCSSSPPPGSSCSRAPARARAGQLQAALLALFAGGALPDRRVPHRLRPGAELGLLPVAPRDPRHARPRRDGDDGLRLARPEVPDPRRRHRPGDPHRAGRRGPRGGVMSKRVTIDPDHPDRGAPPHRPRGRRRRGEEGLVLRDDVARVRADPEGARSRATRGSSPSASAACARRSTRSRRCGRSRTRSASRSR